MLMTLKSSSGCTVMANSHAPLEKPSTSSEGMLGDARVQHPPFFVFLPILVSLSQRWMVYSGKCCTTSASWWSAVRKLSVRIMMCSWLGFNMRSLRNLDLLWPEAKKIPLVFSKENLTLLELGAAMVVELSTIVLCCIGEAIGETL